MYIFVSRSIWQSRVVVRGYNGLFNSFLIDKLYFLAYFYAGGIFTDFTTLYKIL